MISLKGDIIPKLNNEDYFKSFKYRKSDNTLTLKTKEGFNQIEFYSKRTVDKRKGDHSQYGEFAIEIEPVYGIRYNILSKWFEKYSFKSLSDQGNNITIMANGIDFNSQKEFYFLENGKFFNEDYFNFKKQITDNSILYFDKYKSVEDYYKFEIIPIFNNQKKILDCGSDWIFEYLTAVKLFDKNRFQEMVSILKKQIEYMNSRNEPNVAKYNGKFDEIFDYLYNLDL